MAVTVDHDLRHRFGPARDQGQRPTCMSFAASDTHAAVRGPWAELSTEWAYYHAVQRDKGTFDGGAGFLAMLETLKSDGQPIESDWPYITSNSIDPSSWKPPAKIESLFKRLHELATATPGEAIAKIKNGLPVLMSMSISDAFYVPDGAGIVSSNEAIDLSRIHAVIGVGVGRREKEELILIRNSWGPGWGLAGYAWLTLDYLQPRIRRIAILTKEA